MPSSKRRALVETVRSGETAAPAPAAVAERTPPKKRAEKSAERRQAIVAAALAEFRERGYQATRLDDVAKRADVAKGTIYLHFRDKEALFQEIITTMLGPVLSVLEAPLPPNVPTRLILEGFAAHFIREVYGTPRGDVIRLVMTEGPRFPQLAEFHYKHVVARALTAMRALLAQAAARGEIRDRALVDYPHLVVAPMIMAIIWNGLFDRFSPIDVPGLVRTHLDILFGKDGAP